MTRFADMCRKEVSAGIAVSEDVPLSCFDSLSVRCSGSEVSSAGHLSSVATPLCNAQVPRCHRVLHKIGLPTPADGNPLLEHPRNFPSQPLSVCVSDVLRAAQISNQAIEQSIERQPALLCPTV
jgi:hypothetical protein